MAGMEVVVVNSSENGNIDITDLEEKAIKFKDRLGALMITYPSTHGVFESDILKITNIIHSYGGQVYICLLYTSPSPRDGTSSRMPSSA